MLNIPISIFILFLVYALINYISGKRKIKKTKLKMAKVVKIDSALRKTLDIKLSPSAEVIQQMDEALALTKSSFS